MLKADEVRRVLWVTLFLNLAVAATKISYGTASRTQSMFADGFHSLRRNVERPRPRRSLDRLPAGRRQSSLRPQKIRDVRDDRHRRPSSSRRLPSRRARPGLSVPPRSPQITPLSFGIMIGTLLVNLGVSSYEARAGKRLKSDFLLADSRHTASDVLTSLGVIAAMAAAALGYPILDPLAALLIAGVIVRMAILVVKESSDVLCDATRIDTRMLEEIVGKVAGVRKVHDVRTRGRPTPSTSISPSTSIPRCRRTRRTTWSTGSRTPSAEHCPRSPKSSSTWSPRATDSGDWADER